MLNCKLNSKVVSGLFFKGWLLLCLSFNLQLSTFAQQDGQYSQYMFNQLALNPAFAGSKDVLDAVLLYRNQWTGINGAPKDEVFSINTPFKRKKIGLGLQIQAEQIGPKSITGLLGSYSYCIQLSEEMRLYMGVRGGAYSYVFNWDEINYQTKTDALSLTGITQTIVPDADAGLYLTNSVYYAGLSVTHILSSAIRSSNAVLDAQAGELSPHVLFTGGASFLLGEDVVFNPSFLIKSTSNLINGADLNLNFLIQKVLWLGVSVRKNYGIVFLTKYNINEHFKIGYAYDLGLNDIGISGKGTHEILLQYNLFVGNLVKRQRARF